MATKKSAPKKRASNSTLVKIAETIGTVAGQVSIKKDQLVHMASDAIDSVKSTVQNIGGKKVPVKKAVKAAVKKAVKKPVKAAVKTVEKKTAKKVVAAKEVVKKAEKKVAKKVTAAKKAVKKAGK